MSKFRILCVCAGGNVRSHGLAYYLKAQRHAAMAVGLDHFGAAELAPLVEWADFVYTTAEDIHKKMLALTNVEHRHKVTLVPIGKDEWGPSIPQPLLAKIRGLLSNTIFAEK